MLQGLVEILCSVEVLVVTNQFVLQICHLKLGIYLSVLSSQNFFFNFKNLSTPPPPDNDEQLFQVSLGFRLGSRALRLGRQGGRALRLGRQGSRALRLGMQGGRVLWLGRQGAERCGQAGKGAQRCGQAGKGPSAAARQVREPSAAARVHSSL